MSIINLIGIDERAKGEGHLPPTISPPDIHYTTTIDARAHIYPDTSIFIAFNKTFEKRVLNTLRLRDKLSLTEQRPLYLEDSTISHTTSSIFDLVSEKFTKEDPAAIWIFHPLRGFSGSNFLTVDPCEYAQLSEFNGDLERMARDLPFIPFSVGFACVPRLPPDRPPQLPRLLRLTGTPYRGPPEAPETSPLAFDNSWVKIS